MFGWIRGITRALFGRSSDGGVINQISDVVDQWHPSPVTQHKMDIEDQQAGDASQASARSMPLPTHDGWFDDFVDGVNRLVRPTITYWMIGGLIGFWPLPTLAGLDPVMGNILWTVITFWFGSRMLFKDIPGAYAIIQKLKG